MSGSTRSEIYLLPMYFPIYLAAVMIFLNSMKFV